MPPASSRRSAPRRPATLRENRSSWRRRCRPPRPLDGLQGALETGPIVSRARLVEILDPVDHACPPARRLSLDPLALDIGRDERRSLAPSDLRDTDIPDEPHSGIEHSIQAAAGTTTTGRLPRRPHGEHRAREVRAAIAPASRSRSGASPRHVERRLLPVGDVPVRPRPVHRATPSGRAPARRTSSCPSRP